MSRNLPSHNKNHDKYKNINFLNYLDWEEKFRPRVNSLGIPHDVFKAKMKVWMYENEFPQSNNGDD